MGWSTSYTMVAGKLSRDSELKDVGSGLLKFSVPTEESWKNKSTGEWESKTTWWNVVVWGERGKALAERLKKGVPVVVEGTVELNTWKNNDGEEKASLQLKARDITIMSKPAAAQAGPQSPPDDDDLPF